MSQKPGLEAAMMAVEVQMSKMRATAPPWRFAAILHMDDGIVRLQTTVAACGLAGVGEKTADSRCMRERSSVSWFYEGFIRRRNIVDEFNSKI